MKDERLQGLTGRGEARWDPEGLVGSGDTLHDTVAHGEGGATRGDTEGLAGSGDTLHDTMAHGEGGVTGGTQRAWWAAETLCMTLWS